MEGGAAFAPSLGASSLVAQGFFSLLWSHIFVSSPNNHRTLSCLRKMSRYNERDKSRVTCNMNDTNGVGAFSRPYKSTLHLHPRQITLYA